MIRKLKYLVGFICIPSVSISSLKDVVAEYCVSESRESDDTLYLTFDFGRILDVSEIKQSKLAYDNHPYFLYQIDNKLYKLSFEGSPTLNCSHTRFIWHPGSSCVLAVIPKYRPTL